MRWFRRKSKETIEERIRKSLREEPVLQHEWFIYKCRMCGETFTGSWSVGDKDGIRSGYESCCRRVRTAIDTLHWWGGSADGHGHTLRYRPPETAAHACSDVLAGIGDLIGAGIRPTPAATAPPKPQEGVA